MNFLKILQFMKIRIQWSEVMKGTCTLKKNEILSYTLWSNSTLLTMCLYFQLPKYAPTIIGLFLSYSIKYYYRTLLGFTCYYVFE